jgi:hypothetical protein
MQRDYRSTHHCRDTAVFSICFRPQVNKINPDVKNKHPSSFQVLGLIGVTAKKKIIIQADGYSNSSLAFSQQVQNGISSNSFFFEHAGELRIISLIRENKLYKGEDKE